MRTMLSTLLVVGIAVVAFVDDARADGECFPACRSGYECQNGTCVPAGASECVPPCRAGYHCQGGQCVADAVAAPAAAQAPARPKKPKKPPKPPRFELSAFAAFPDNFLGKDNTDLSDDLEPGVYLGGRGIDFGGRLKIRESAAGRAWIVLEVGHGLVDFSEVNEGGGWDDEGDTGGMLIAVEQLFRIPIQGPGYGWALDNRASLDISFGAFLMSSKKTDVGGQANVQLSLYWLEFGPMLYYGIESGLGIGFGTGLHFAF